MAKRQSARQKMINLMYLVFIAMMALNIPTEVLAGFDLLNENLQKAINNAITRNNQLYAELEEAHTKSPAKTEKVYTTSLDMKAKTDSLFEYIQELKEQIAIETDGPNANVDKLDAKEDIDASSTVMVAPFVGQGYNLKDAIDKYRASIVEILKEGSDTSKIDLIESSLSTNPSERALAENKDWVVASFDKMPSIATISFLTGLQSNIKTAEGEVLTNLIKEIDFRDYRVNALEAFVVPESNIVMVGTPYKAQIALAAIDTTQRPSIVIGGSKLSDFSRGIYSFTPNSIGTNAFSGYIEVMGRDGRPIRKSFRQEYTVVEPMATVAPLLMDVVYAGIDNPLSISVPGVTEKDVEARAIGGTLRPKGKDWIARPGKVGGNFVVEVYANKRLVAKKTFRIRELPDPIPYIDYVDSGGNKKKFKRGAIPRAALLGAKGIKAEIDDGILNIPFKVVSFRTIFIDVMQNALPENSNGAYFSQRQIAQFQKVGRGKYFFISSIKVVGPDGLQREISAMEVRLN